MKNPVVEKLNKYGYTTIHLFGNWYWCRIYSTQYMKISPWWIFYIKQPMIFCDPTPGCPEGEFRL